MELFILFILLLILSIIIYLKNRTFFLIIRNNKTKENNEKILYEGSHLYEPAKKKIYDGKKLDCNCNLLECNEDSDCNAKCLSMPNYNNTKCLNGLCVYIKNKNQPYCENDGQVTNYFTLGRMIIGCICNDEGKFIGRFCQIPNLMRQQSSNSFSLEIQN